jgi:hypothetical protein
MPASRVLTRQIAERTALSLSRHPIEMGVRVHVFQGLVGRR